MIDTIINSSYQDRHFFKFLCLLFAVVSMSVMLTVDTFASGLVTVVSKAIALTGLAGRELPKVELTLVTMLSLNAIVAVTLTRLDVAEVVLGTTSVTVARRASIWSEAICADSTLGASTSVNVGTTQTITASPVAYAAG